MEHNYYGRNASKPIENQKGLHMHMMDEHLAKLVDKQIQRFQREIEAVIFQFKKDAFSDFKALRKDVDTLKAMVIKLINKLKDDNVDSKEMLDSLDNMKILIKEKKYYHSKEDAP